VSVGRLRSTPEWGSGSDTNHALTYTASVHLQVRGSCQIRCSIGAVLHLQTAGVSRQPQRQSNLLHQPREIALPLRFAM